MNEAPLKLLCFDLNADVFIRLGTVQFSITSEKINTIRNQFSAVADQTTFG
jgi:hypothetical protein